MRRIMNNNIARNIIINKINRKNRMISLTPDDNTLRLAEYYTKVFARTVERMHMTSEQKSQAMSAVNMEYYEILSARRSMGMVS